MASTDRHDGPSPKTHLPRRTLMAAGAWAVPVVAAATAAPAYAASPCMTIYNYTLAWGSTSYTRTSGTAAYATLTPSVAGGDTIYVHFTTVATLVNAVDVDRNLTLSNQGNNSLQDPTVNNLGATGQRGLRLQHNNVRAAGRGINDANAQVLKISFRQGPLITSPLVNVHNVGFYVTDIDGLNTNGYTYADRISLSPNPTTLEQTRDTNTNALIAGTTNTALVSIIGTGTDGDPWKLVTGNGTGTTQSLNNIDETSAGTKVRVQYENNISRSMQVLTLKYWSNVATTIYHRTYLTNITFKARRFYCG